MIKEMLLAAETSVNLDFLSKYWDVVTPDPVLVVYREWYRTGKLCVRQLEDDESFLDLISYWRRRFRFGKFSLFGLPGDCINLYSTTL